LWKENEVRPEEKSTSVALSVKINLLEPCALKIPTAWNLSGLKDILNRPYSAHVFYQR
jgi:hypothetical protein